MVKTGQTQWVIYLPLPTETKLFSSAMQVSSSENEHTLVNQFPDPVSWGYPGGLATVNQQAIKFGTEAAAVFHCELAERIRFERKNFLDPSLPGGYQIVQEKFPVGKNGEIKINKKTSLTVESVGLTTAKGMEMTDEKGRRRFNYDFVGNPLLKIVVSLDSKQAIDFELSLEEVKSVLKQLSWLTDSLLDDIHFELIAYIDAESMIQVEVIDLQTEADLQLASHFLQNEVNFILEKKRTLQVWKLLVDPKTQKRSLEMEMDTPSEYLILFDQDIPDVYLTEV